MIDVVIPLYKPDKEIYDKIKKILKKQTVKNRVLEIKNLPEAVAMNAGLKKAKGEIVVNLVQDCIPEDEKFLEKLIEPFKDKEVVASNADTCLPYDYWKNNYGIVTRALTAKEQRCIRSLLDMRGCAFRKSALKKIGWINEDPNLIGIDDEVYFKLEKLGKIAHPGCKMFHLHPLTWKKRLRLEYKYAQGAGSSTKECGLTYPGVWKRLLKATPVLGIIPTLAVFPVLKFPGLFFVYLLLSPILNAIYFWGFWKGFLRKK